MMNKHMTITIINDCRDANAAGRQVARAASLFGAQVSFVGVGSDLEAAGNLIDILDAIGDSEGVVLVNVAPRNGKAKKWQNGAPFGYFWYKRVLVVTSVDGFTLSLVKKLRLIDAAYVFDVDVTLDELITNGALSGELRNSIAHTQFRSYNFLPRVAAYLLKHKDITGMRLAIGDIPDAEAAVWWVDNFGNCKTTAFSNDAASREEICKQARFGTLTYVPQLKDVPDNVAALVQGSSGLGEQRFLEIVVQGGSAARRFGLSSGDTLL